MMEECGFPALPNGVDASRLSRILEDNPLPKYALSERACLGILNRAAKRGKELPKELKEALERQAVTPSKSGGGREVDSSGKKAGKGALVQEEKAGTIGVSQDQTLIKTFGISSYDSNAMKSDNPNSGFYEADTSRTLDNNGGSPACNQGGVAVVQKALNGWDVQSKHIQPQDGIAESLYAGECRYGGGESYVMAVDAWNGTEAEECNGNLQSSASHNIHSNNVVRVSSS